MKTLRCTAAPCKYYNLRINPCRIPVQRTQAESELLNILAAAENDVQNGRTAPVENTFRDIRRRLLTD